ncbi:hypothetical protein PDESU_03314 [Pontiella desulfatans]|uniref:Uncharacterized protein n=1 Tax=Pontiella desulfatans TaxID=2750659 RepID=A0A6C2U4C1_PONDE|nr:hypothetical protein [Pontiella desulfatans]VGO14745.1 hypothetical protein PDESU_03314 [Pontiella desulfatans]
MAEITNTLAGLIQMNDMNLDDIEVSDLLESAPVLAALFAKEASNGTLHKYLKETVAPGAAFRDVNTGRANAAGQETLVTATLKVLDASFERDKAIALGYSKGKLAYMAREAVKSIRAAFAMVEKQIINGTGNDSDGFAALKDGIDSNMVLKATGSTASVQTSCYIVRSTDDDIAVVAGQDGNLDISDVFETVINTDDTDDTKLLSVLAMSIMGWLGVQLGSVFSALRICNIEDATGDTLTDDLIYNAIAMFPTDRQPTHIIMNRAGLRMLRESRTATNATGAPAPRPTEVDGIPIIVTDAITSTEAVVA